MKPQIDKKGASFFSDAPGAGLESPNRRALTGRLPSLRSLKNIAQEIGDVK